MQKSLDVICLGELLIDFVALRSGVTLKQAYGFKKAAGGAPANVSVGLAKLGLRAGFIGKVGNDAFGRFLVDVLNSNGVDTSQVLFEDKARTMLAFVSLTSSGERDFMFYRHPAADMLLEPQELNSEYLKATKIFHFGSISLINEPSRSATLKAIELSKAGGAIISYDPNLRLSLWENEKIARDGLNLGLPFAQLLKVSEVEVEFLTGYKDIKEGAQALLTSAENLELVVVTLGRDGCFFKTKYAEGSAHGFAVKTVDTTGAGDGFVAGMLAKITEEMDTMGGLSELLASQTKLSQIFKFANTVGALTTTKKGAIPGLPTRRQVVRFLERIG